LLTYDTQIAAWNNEGLPNDRMSSENATILTNSVRWPLMVDPQVHTIFIFKQNSNKYCKVMFILFLNSFKELNGLKQNMEEV